MGEYTKDEIIAFINSDIIPLIEQQSGSPSRRMSLARAVLFVLKNRTVENWGPRALDWDAVMFEELP